MKALSYVEYHAAQENEANGNGSLPSGITKRSADDSQASTALDPEALKQARDEVLKMGVKQRMGAARSEDFSAAMLAVLAEDDDWQVRGAVARNENTPAEALAALTKDKSSEVRHTVARNIKTPPDVLLALSNYGDTVSYSAQHNPSLPLSRILELFSSGEEYERASAVFNPSLPYENLLLMLGDHSEYVRKCAEEVLRERSSSAGI